MLLIKSYWFGRFKVFSDDEIYLFLDTLSNARHEMECDRVNFLLLKPYGKLSEDVALFLVGFVFDSPHSYFIAGTAQGLDCIYKNWQFPVVTEFDSKIRHSDTPIRHSPNLFLNIYVAFPWANYLDRAESMAHILSIFKVRLSGIINVLKEFNIKIVTHTVCQHIFWDRCIPIWQELGITDVWLSHMPSYVDPDLPFKIHPWALYAVNVEDSDRREGLEIGKDPTSKTLIASFIGAHSEGYISDVRLKLCQFSEELDFLIRVTDKWHFEDVVYKHQMQGLPLEGNYVIDDSVREYNVVLSNSIFALCPSGAGPNSIRLWEALAVGSIPVLLGKFPVLPRDGSLPEIDWDSIVLKVSDDQLPQLPQILRSMPMDEIRALQKRGMEAYALVREQRCF
jgi:hypothetical protein